MNSDKITEQQNSASSRIDEQSVLDILEIINEEDIGVPLIVQKSLPQIKTFIDALISRFQDGGRLFYVGSGTSGRLGILDAAECPPTYSTDPEMVQGIIAGGNDALVHFRICTICGRTFCCIQYAQSSTCTRSNIE
jgi:N-acetylmuramic acid 6-phosphate etherase